MELSEELLRGIYVYGFEKPSAIQQRAIKPTILGRDLIAQAQSGTVRTYLLLPMHLLRGLMCGGLSAARATYLGCKEEERSEGRRDEEHHKYITFRV